MSSHREAPEISKDPVADSTDLYAFVSPDKPDTVTLIANYIPLEAPAGGPNFFEFGDDVQYKILIDNDADGKAEIAYTFQFHTKVRDNTTFLYNTGQIKKISDTTWNRPQKYQVFKTENGTTTRLASGLRCPPCNIGPRSTPDYATLSAEAIHHLHSGEKVFAGQRREGFYVDLGSIFDLAALRPFQGAHLINVPGSSAGINSLANSNVHSIAIQLPKSMLTSDGSDPTDPTNGKSIIGVWTTASRRRASVRENGVSKNAGPYVQVSRLGNPLINEVIIPMAQKDYWNSTKPWHDSQFGNLYAHPILQTYLTVLYPGVFPHLAAYSKPRVDLEAILLTGIPAGIVAPTYSTYTGPTQADMLRLNMAIPPAASPSIYGVLGGDVAGFPNGRRVQDDVVTIELECVAGASIGLVDHSYSADGAATAIFDVGPVGSKPPAPPVPAAYKSSFPYLADPLSGYDVPAA
jgi:Domain of unknown function (DUF4331)